MPSSLTFESSPVFTQGAFNSHINKTIGKGWNTLISSPSFFVMDLEYDIGNMGGLCIDLYNLFTINPIENIKFEFILNPLDTPIKYFNFLLMGNILNIVPLEKLVMDNHPNTQFLLEFLCTGLSTGTTIVTKVKINYNNLYTPPLPYKEKLILKTDHNNFKINLNTIVLDSYLPQDSKINILTVNSNPLSILGLVNSQLISNNYLDLSSLPLGNLEIVLKINNLYISTINIINNLVKIPEILVRDIHIKITPKDANLIDIKKYTIGKINNLKCEQMDAWSDEKANNYFNFNIVNNLISVIPYTENLIDINFGLKDSKVFHTTIKYFSGNQIGIFKLFVSVDMNNAILNKNDYLKLIPTVETKTIKISNGDLATSSNPLNLLSLVKNHYFPSKEGKYFNNNQQDIIGSTIEDPVIKLNNVNGINLYNINPITKFEPIPITLNSILTNNIIKINFIIEDDKNL